MTRSGSKASRPGGASTGNSRKAAGSTPSPGHERLEAVFVTSAAGLDGCPAADRPEVAVAGRSNVGKSSVLNRLTGNRNTARVSKTPGRTQLLNFFDVLRIGADPCRGRLVDLPGYGYARAGRAAQARWQATVNEFLGSRPNLSAVALVMDIRHPLQPFDREIIDWAAASKLPLLVVLNKSDKLKHGARQQALAAVRRHIAELPEAQAVVFSALTGQNVDVVLDVLRGWLDCAAAEADR